MCVTAKSIIELDQLHKRWSRSPSPWKAAENLFPYSGGAARVLHSHPLSTSVHLSLMDCRASVLFKGMATDRRGCHLAKQKSSPALILSLSIQSFEIILHCHWGRREEELKRYKSKQQLSEDRRALTNMVKHHSPWPEGEKLFCSEKLSTCAWWAESLVSSSLSKDEGETGAEVYFLSCMKSLRIRHARKTDHAGCVPPSPYHQASTKRRYSKGRSQCQVEQSGWQFVTKPNVDIAPKTSGYDSKFSCV